MAISDDLQDIALFRSPQFTPFLPDDCQANPGVYGAELAYWLASELAQRKLITSYPLAEDWGWLLSYETSSGDEFSLHCGNEEGSRDKWLISLRRHAHGLFGRDKPAFAEAAALVEGIRAVLLSSAAIAELEWLAGESGQH
ncbi:hypothetical protein [Massilia sp. erpn]|uniref:hypothetical protein n=1 Tax=Massilia sp. erpn TaxID=2738142 RepID=UPI0021081E7F|nr:hypothetical protein [Massilia sp. erpn]UTY58677.1 hypothetical protein HPQ68_16680 [Massilia sp. erpn]